MATMPPRSPARVVRLALLYEDDDFCPARLRVSGSATHPGGEILVDPEPLHRAGWRRGDVLGLVETCDPAGPERRYLRLAEPGAARAALPTMGTGRYCPECRREVLVRDIGAGRCPGCGVA